ncbi:MAG: hypothetical protein ABW157_22165 [Candidatus Thiodiazotropha sp. LLP2]
MSRKTVKMIHEGNYAAEIEVELIEDETGWSPYLASDETEKLDILRRALASGDLKTATSMAKVYKLKTVAA